MCLSMTNEFSPYKNNNGNVFLKPGSPRSVWRVLALAQISLKFQTVTMYI